VREDAIPEIDLTPLLATELEAEPEAVPGLARTPPLAATADACTWGSAETGRFFASPEAPVGVAAAAEDTVRAEECPSTSTEAARSCVAPLVPPTPPALRGVRGGSPLPAEEAPAAVRAEADVGCVLLSEDACEGVARGRV